MARLVKPNLGCIKNGLTMKATMGFVASFSKEILAISSHETLSMEDSGLKIEMSFSIIYSSSAPLRELSYSTPLSLPENTWIAGNLALLSFFVYPSFK